MKTTATLAIFLSLMSVEAMAISRYDSQTLSCERIQDVVDREGAVILRYTSERGNPLYDRYVRNGGFCSHNEVTDLIAVPTSDTASCPVLRCSQRTDDDRFFN